MVNTVRVVAGLLGVGLMIGGLAGVATGAWADGLWSIVAGAVVLDRRRAGALALPVGGGRALGCRSRPGGGEPSVPQAPFRPTDEVFVDPTSGHRLRVYLNPATGERRYHAEGER